jgi:ABC-type Na+ efflux pump permease subunit
VLVGPVFSREAAVAPRRSRHYINRAVYAAALLLLICTAWLIVTGTQPIRNIGDMAQFGSLLFQILAPLQLALILFLSAIQSASSIAVEKDRQTLILLLMTRLSNSELVLGKLFSSLLNIGVMLMTAVPIFMLIVLFGGTSFAQVGWTFAVTGITALAAGSLGATIALWREKTFQSLALVALAIVFWIGLFEGIGLVGGTFFGFDANYIAGAFSPLQAILAASGASVDATWQTTVLPYLIVAATVSFLLCMLAIWRVRIWNPSRDVRPGQQESVAADGAAALANTIAGKDENAIVTETEHLRSGHVDDRKRETSKRSRRVWDNPILWREMCTWAYGRKILFIRLAYWLLAACVAFAIFSLVQSGAATRVSSEATITIPATARPMAPFLLVSLVMLNALAVTSITNERDGRALDLLRVTDISPKEFLFGKLFGVLYVTLDVVLIPIALSVYIWYSGGLTTENLLYLIAGMAVLNVFVTVLGLHCGMSYAGSRQAIAVSLGTVFFLFLGVVTSMVMLVSFSGNVEAQLTPFLACIIGGAIGLYVALGWHTPSPALALASAILPLAMFYSITSLMLQNYTSVILVLTFTYGFATTAMIMPRLSEFLVSAGRFKAEESE